MTRPRNKHGITLEQYRDSMTLYVRRGEEVQSSKLTAEDVRAIRTSPARHSAWAQKLGVSEATIRAVRTYASWRQVR